MTPTRSAKRLRIASLAGVTVVTALATGAVLEVVREPCPEPVVVIEQPMGELLLQEGFDDGDLSARGWYDNTTRLVLDNGATRFSWLAGASAPTSGGATRRQFTAQRGVSVRFRIKFGSGWVGSGLPYHPHLVHILSTESPRYSGLARTALNIYIEENAGRAVFAISDQLNIGTPDGAVAPPEGRFWRSESAPLTPGVWHEIRVDIKLNTPGQADGLMSYWVDGTRVLHDTAVLYRTVAYPEMLLNQIVIAPWLERSPVEQTIWLDYVELRSL